LTASTGAYIIHKGAAGKDDLKRLQDDSWNFQEHVVDAFNDEQRSHWEGLPTELRSLIERCLVLNKDARPTASQILESVEFSDLRQLSRLDYTAANATAAGATGAAGDSEVVVPNVANSGGGTIGRVRLLSSLSPDEVVYLISKALKVSASAIEAPIKEHNIDGDILSAVDEAKDLDELGLISLKQKRLFKLITETWKVHGVPAEQPPVVETPEVTKKRARAEAEAERLEVEMLELEARKRAVGSRWSNVVRASVLAFQAAGNCGGVVFILKDFGPEDPEVALQVSFFV
jgi:hypothetical protein